MGAADPQPAEAVRQLMPVSQLLLAEAAARQGLFWPENYCLRFRPSLNLLRVLTFRTRLLLVVASLLAFRALKAEVAHPLAGAAVLHRRAFWFLQKLLSLLRSSLPVISLGGVTCLAVAVAAAWRTRRP